MPSRHHVLVNKNFENCQAGQRVALSPTGIAAFRSKSKYAGHVTELAEELEDGRIVMAGAPKPLDLEHSRTLLQRDGTLADGYADLAKPDVFAKNKKEREANAKAPAANRQAEGPAQAR